MNVSFWAFIILVDIFLSIWVARGGILAIVVVNVIFLLMATLIRYSGEIIGVLRSFDSENKTSITQIIILSVGGLIVFDQIYGYLNDLRIGSSYQTPFSVVYWSVFVVVCVVYFRYRSKK
ncbi:MAG: hypothetical protein WAV68_00735 [Candidatus Nanogingivalis sp.]